MDRWSLYLALGLMAISSKPAEFGMEVILVLAKMQDFALMSDKFNAGKIWT
jgi:hypothetical protein